MKSFTFRTAERILFGMGSLRYVGEEIVRIGAFKIAVISDLGVRRAGIVDKVLAVLDSKDLSYGVWDKVEPEPALTVGEEAIEFVRRGGYDGVIGVGGGSTLDTAKVSAVSITNSGTLADWVENVFSEAPAPLILMPTTAGTGSEVSNVAIFATPEVKYALYSPLMYPDVAVVDPCLTRTLPPSLTAHSGVDALCHAVEAYVSLESSAVTDALAMEAIRLVSKNIRVAYRNGADMEARTAMSLAALMAGLAFGNAGTVLGHACGYAYSYPATDLHVPHGLAVGTMLPFVLEYNALSVPHKHSVIAKLLGESVEGLSLEDAAFRSAEGFREVLRDLDMPLSARELGVTENMISSVAKNVFRSPKHVSRNPRKVTIESMIELFGKAYDGK